MLRRSRLLLLACCLFAACAKKPVVAYSGTLLTLADLQAKYPGVSQPMPDWHLRSDELHGESFELFDSEVVFGVFQTAAASPGGVVHVAVHLVAPTSRVKLRWSLDHQGMETTTFGPTTRADCSAYFDRDFHGSMVEAELLELDGAPCSRKTQFRIR